MKRRKGHVNILFANAGLGEFAPLEAITESYFYKTFSVNVKGLLFTVQKALPLFRNGGSIILNASTAASKAAGGSSVYGATKAAVRSFARSWTVELKDRKIRVNAISPGPIDIPGLRGLLVVWLRVKNRSSRSRRSLYPPYQWNVWEVLTKLQKSSHSSRLMIAVLSPVANCLSMEVWHKSK